MYPKSDGQVSDIIKYKPLQEELKIATENDLEMIWATRSILSLSLLLFKNINKKTLR